MDIHQHQGHRSRPPHIEDRIRSTVEHRMHENSVSVLETIEQRYRQVVHVQPHAYEEEQPKPKLWPKPVEQFVEEEIQQEQEAPKVRGNWFRKHFLLKSIAAALAILVIGLGIVFSTGNKGKQQLNVETDNAVHVLSGTNSSNTVKSGSKTTSKTSAPTTPSTTGTTTTKTTVITKSVVSPSPSPSPSPAPSPNPAPSGGSSTGGGQTNTVPNPTPNPAPAPPPGSNTPGSNTPGSATP